MAEATLFVGAADSSNEDRARALAQRYRSEFVDLKNYHIQHELFRSVPVDLMFRYNFVPLEEHGDELIIAISDPSRLMMIDEIGLLLNKRVHTKVATLAQIEEILKKTEQSQRVLDEATEGFTFDVVREDEAGDETISIERLTSERTSVRSSASSIPRSSLRWSGAPPTFILRPSTIQW
jgi:type IV pilus assembly protein PilB